MAFQSTYDPLKQYLDWSERTGNLASWGVGSTGIDRSSVSPVGLSVLGAPSFMTAMAQQQSSATPNVRASEFLMKLRELLGGALRQQIPGIENADMNTPRRGFVANAGSMPRVESLLPTEPYSGGYSPEMEALMAKFGLPMNPYGQMRALEMM